MSLPDELRKLEEMRASGGLSEEEFAQAKAKLLGAGGPGMTEAQVKNWLVLLHLSQLAGWVVPYAGFAAPVLIWQLKKDEIPGVDAHGKVVVNWIISAVIYSVATIVLSFCLIGIPLLIALAAVGVIFPMVGAIKANQGILWKYPLSIPFFK